MNFVNRFRKNLENKFDLFIIVGKNKTEDIVEYSPPIAKPLIKMPEVYAPCVRYKIYLKIRFAKFAINEPVKSKKSIFSIINEVFFLYLIIFLNLKNKNVTKKLIKDQIKNINASSNQLKKRVARYKDKSWKSKKIKIKLCLFELSIEIIKSSSSHSEHFLSVIARIIVDK